MNTTPTEYDECLVFADWLTLKGFRFSHLAQETFTKSWGIKMKNKKMGVKKGVPDYIILLPEKGIVFVEMKRTKGAAEKPEQIEWINAINALPNSDAKVCYGANQAIDYISSFFEDCIDNAYAI